MYAAIESLNEQKSNHLAQNEALRSETAQIQANIKQRREAQAQHQRALDAQARHNIPELRFWEQCLGLKIEGTGVEDRLRFVYVCVDEKEPESECWFDLDTSRREYEVVGTSPKLEKEGVEEMQSALNSSRDLGLFLKGMRGLFVQAKLDG
jgi:kinetochore protein Spc25, fungi type